MNNKLNYIFLLLAIVFLKNGTGQNNVLNFDGVNDYVDISSVAPVLANDDTYTVEFWMRANVVAQQNPVHPVLFAINNNASPVSSENLITLSINDVAGPLTGELVVSWGTGVNGNGGNTLNTGAVIGDDNCHHIAYVRYFSTEYVYVDGDLVATGNATNATLQDANCRFSIGQEYDLHWEPGQYYQGDINEFRIWSYPRTAMQIDHNMSVFITSGQQGLLANYNCNQGTASANNTSQNPNPGFVDIINGFNGTFNNFTLNGNISNFIDDPLQTIQLIASGPLNPCTNDVVFLTETSPPGTVNNYTWTNTTTQNSAGNGQSIQVYPPDAIYEVNATGPVCSVVLPDQISVNWLNSPTLSVTVNSPLCEGSSINISAQNTSSFKCVSSSWQWYENSNGTPMAIAGQTGSQLAIPAYSYPVGTEFSVELCCGDTTQCCTTVVAGKIAAKPIVNFPPVAPIDLCGFSGQPIQLGANGNALVCGYTSSNPGLNQQTGEFDPVVAGVGQHLVTYQCETAGCITFAAQTVVVTDNGNWHQTTLNTQGKESANDVITDSDGNVYVTGEYMVETTLDGGVNNPVTMNTGTTAPEIHSYTAKYDDCANLIWVNYATTQGPNAINWGTSITLDEINDYVYCSGNFEHELNYEGPFGDISNIGPFSQHSISSAGFQEGYVVRMKMSDGTLEYLDPVQAGKITELRAITINENTGDIFVGGHKNGPENIGEDRAFVNKYIPSNSTIGTEIWQIIDSRDGNSYINDMALNENQGNGGLWTIGEYDNEFQFMGQQGQSSTLFNNNIGVMDAFVTLYTDDNGGPIENYVIKGNSDGLMTGRGIAIDEASGNAFVTGSYEDAISDPFQLGGYFLTNNATSNAYFVALDAGANSPWSDARYAEADEIEAKGVAASFKNEQVYFTGTYSFEADFDGSSQLTLPYSAAGGTAGNEHVYLVSYDSNGEPVWVNGTEDPNLNNAVHLPTSVAADNYGHAFIVGSYSEDLGYIQGNPASGVLTSTGNQALNINAFIMRSDLGNNGAFKNATASEAAQAIIDKKDINISLAPNPTSHQTTLTVADFDSELNYSFILYGIDGKIMSQGKIEAKGAILDFEAFQAGVYFVQVSNGTEMELAKILKVE